MLALIDSDKSETDSRDPSPLVRAVLLANQHPFTLVSHFPSITHLERKLAIGLAHYVNATDLVEFLKESLTLELVTDIEAAELIYAYTHNEILMAVFKKKKHHDGMDWYAANRNYEAMWNWANYAPDEVAKTIAWYFPLGQSVHSLLSVPDEVVTGKWATILEQRGYCKSGTVDEAGS